MIFLLGLFVGFLVGIVTAGLCNAARGREPISSAAGSNPEVIQGAA